MPNLKGGKKYKSSKHSTDEKVDYHEINEADGQMVGRVLRALGNRRMLIFCNDKVQRICLIRNAIKRVRIGVGDIVLISIRDFSETSDNKGDILAKYDHSILPKLRREPGINPDIFVSMDKDGGERTGAEEGFVFENDSSDDEEDDEAEKKKREEAALSRDVKRGAARDLKQGVEKEDDIDIDAI